MGWGVCAESVKVRSAHGVQFSITAIGVMVLQGALNAFGSGTVAAYTVGSKVEMVVSQPFVALGVTMATFCGQNLEQEDLTGLKKASAKECFCAFAHAACCCLYGFGGPFASGYLWKIQAQKLWRRPSSI